MNGRTISEIIEKFEALKESFFLTLSTTNLNNIDESEFLEELNTDLIVSKNEVIAAIRKVLKNKVLGLDGILN